MKTLGTGTFAVLLLLQALVPLLVWAEDPLLDPYGFLRLDLIFDDSRMQHPQFAFWVLPEDPRVCAQNCEEFVIHPRVTRLGVKLNPRPLSDRTNIRGVVEIDFQNGGSESRETPRMRLAYFELFTGNWRFLGGQNWDVASPLYPTCHTDGILWNAGNLGDRRPQVAATFAPVLGATTLTAEVALAQAGAIDAQNLDANSRIDAIDGARPQVQGRVGIRRALGAGIFSLGGWGHHCQTRTETDVHGRTTFDSWSVGGDVQIPIGSRVNLKGEAWTGENLSDVRGGIGQGVNPLTGIEIESRGGWGEVGVKVSEVFSCFAGASIDDPVDSQVPSTQELEDAGEEIAGTGRTRNHVAYLSTRWKPWPPFVVGAEYFYWVTEYRGLDRGTSNRINLHFSYVF